MRIDMIPTGDNPPESLNVVIEVPIGGEPIKYEMDKAAGALIVDAILDAAAQGQYTVRRGPVRATYRSRFVLIGSMNPEEGELRPQLLDRRRSLGRQQRVGTQNRAEPVADQATEHAPGIGQLDVGPRVVGAVVGGFGVGMSKVLRSLGLRGDVSGPKCALIFASMKLLSKSPTATTAIKSGRYQSV